MDLIRTVRPAAQTEPPDGGASDLVLVQCLHPYQLNWIDDTHATVSYPVGSDTVLSVAPDNTWTLVPREIDGELNAGPYETALVQGATGRVVFAPKGSAGTAYVLPYTDSIPNV